MCGENYEADRVMAIIALIILATGLISTIL